MRVCDGPEHLEEVLTPVQLRTKLHPLQVVGDLLDNERNQSYLRVKIRSPDSCPAPYQTPSAPGDREFPGDRTFRSVVHPFRSLTFALVK